MSMCASIAWWCAAACRSWRLRALPPGGRARTSLRRERSASMGRSCRRRSWLSLDTGVQGSGRALGIPQGPGEALGIPQGLGEGGSSSRHPSGLLAHGNVPLVHAPQFGKCMMNLLLAPMILWLSFFYGASCRVGLIHPARLILFAQRIMTAGHHDRP